MRPHITDGMDPLELRQYEWLRRRVNKIYLLHQMGEYTPREVKIENLHAGTVVQQYQDLNDWLAFERSSGI